VKENLSAMLSRFIGWALLGVTLAVTPWWALDPINPIKMLLVVAVAFMIFGVLLVNKKEINWKSFRSLLVALTFFFLWQVVVLFASGTDYLRQLFGDSGRNTGLITYFAFVVLMFASAVAANANALKWFQIIGFIVGGASLVYGLIQAAGLDPIEWVNPYSPVFGFLGNPNFQSSLLGILGAMAFAQLIAKESSAGLRVFIIGYLGLTGFVILKTDSQQGFLVLLIGIAVILGIFVRSRFIKLLSIAYWCLLAVGFIAVLVGTLNKGPLASILYKSSVTYRGDYWRAGWNMTLDHPIFGVGMDNYGDWYRRSRTIEATLRRGPDTVSNAAHNVYLDISSYGGFPLLIAYLAITALVAISAVKVLRRSSGFNTPFAGVFGGWVAFQAQSIISINQIGLAIWGWVLSGLIIGYEINTRGGEVIETKKKVQKSAKSSVKSSPATSVAIFVGLIIGVLAGMPPYLASAKFKSALESGDVKTLQVVTEREPVTCNTVTQVAIILVGNKLEQQATEVMAGRSEKLKDCFNYWKVWSTIPSATEQQKSEALVQMKRLDPLNPDLK
jgi:O-antigen ligase